MDRSAHMAIAAAKEAIKDADINLDKENPYNINVLMGTGIGGLGYAEKEHLIYIERGLDKVSPYLAITPFCGALSSEVSIEFGLKGFSLTVSTGCTGSNDAIGLAYNMIKFGNVDTIITGGVDACITPLVVGAFCRINALSTKRNNYPKKASRPFDKDRDGFVLGEGCWIIILESLDRALKRKAPIYAELLGWGSTCDAHHMTAPSLSGKETAEAIKQAIVSANISPSDIDYVCAHGTSTPLNDKHETKALKMVFEKKAYTIPISSIKSMIGHAVGGAGAANVAATILAIKYNLIPPTINYESVDPDCDLDYVPNTARTKEINFALANSIGFGGKNSAIILGKYKD